MLIVNGRGTAVGTEFVADRAEQRSIISGFWEVEGCRTRHELMNNVLVFEYKVELP